MCLGLSGRPVGLPVSLLLLDAALVGLFLKFSGQ